MRTPRVCDWADGNVAKETRAGGYFLGVVTRLQLCRRCAQLYDLAVAMRKAEQTTDAEARVILAP